MANVKTLKILGLKLFVLFGLKWNTWIHSEGFELQLIYVDERKSLMCQQSVTVHLFSVPSDPSALLFLTLSFCFCLPLPPPLLLLVVCWLPTEVNRKDKLTNQKLVQHKVRGHRSADSMSDGKSRPTGQWLHSLEIYTHLSFYRKLNHELCGASKRHKSARKKGWNFVKLQFKFKNISVFKSNIWKCGTFFSNYIKMCRQYVRAVLWKKTLSACTFTPEMRWYVTFQVKVFLSIYIPCVITKLNGLKILIQNIKLKAKELIVNEWNKLTKREINIDTVKMCA